MKVQFFILAFLAITSTTAQSNTLADVVQAFQGFVNGVDQEINVEDVAPCINDAEAIFNSFVSAIQALAKNNAGSVWQAIQDLVQGLTYLPNAVQTCQGASVEITNLAKAIAMFGSPEAFFFDVAGHIFVNHKEITVDIQDAIKAWNSQDWEDFGFYIGEAIGIAIIGNPKVNTVTVVDLPFIFEGILSGVGAQTGYPQIEQCIQISSDIAENITEASSDFATKNYQQILEGIILIAETLQVLPTAIQDCQGAYEDVLLLWNALQQYENPKSFIYNTGKNLLINGVDIYDELSNATTNYINGEWFYYGYDIGMALATIVWGSNSSISLGNDAQNILAFAQGFLEGIASAENWEAIQNCISTSETILLELSWAYNNFTLETPPAVLEGLVALGQAAEIIPNAVQQCNASINDIESLIQAIASFQSPASFAYHVGVSLLLNGREIYHEITNAVNAYKAQNWNQFGYYIGEAFATLMLGNDQVLTQEFVDFLNTRSGWQASLSPRFANMTFNQIEEMLTCDVDTTGMNITEFDYTNSVEDIPVSFDARQVWPNCVHPIRDQGQCGSCWAFAGTETLSDRLCIASNGSTNVVLSPQYLVSCDRLNFGCNGGNLYLSWTFMANTGVVSDACDPYQSENGESPKCADFKQCANGEDMEFYYSKKRTIAMLTNPTSIQVNLMQYGPVDTGMQVYQDFMNYESGIYVHTSGQLLGGHAVKIVGWGQQNGENYWIVANSWGTSWGMDGFFYIAFGQCGIDSDAVSAQADPGKNLATLNSESLPNSENFSTLTSMSFQSQSNLDVCVHILK